MIAPRCIRELRSDEDAANGEGRTDQLLHGSYAFSGEQLLSFPGFSAMKIAS